MTPQHLVSSLATGTTVAASCCVAIAVITGCTDFYNSSRLCQRRCKVCFKNLKSELFTAKQWLKAESSKGGTCLDCAAQLDKQRLESEANVPVKQFSAWSGRRCSRASRGKAPRHGLGDSDSENKRSKDWKLVVAENVDDYRAAIMTEVQATDHVLELGCHEGTTTVLLANVARVAVGLDKGSHGVTICNESCSVPCLTRACVSCVRMHRSDSCGTRAAPTITVRGSRLSRFCMFSDPESKAMQCSLARFGSSKCIKWRNR